MSVGCVPRDTYGGRCCGFNFMSIEDLRMQKNYLVIEEILKLNGLGPIGPPTLAKTLRHDCTCSKKQVRPLFGPITPKTVELKSELRKFVASLRLGIG